MKMLLIFLLIPWLLKAQDIPPNPNELIIDKIVCEGNESTSCELIQKEIYLNVGDKVNEEELSNAKIRLQLRNLFKSVNIFMKKGSERGRVEVVVEVIEGNPFFMEVDYSLEGTKDSNFHNRRVSLGNRNLFGLGKAFRFTYVQDEFSWQERKFYNAAFSYTDPNLLGSKKLFLNLSASFRRPMPGTSSSDNFGELVFDKEDGYSVLLGYRIFDFSYLAISQTKEKWFAHSKYNNETAVVNSGEDLLTYGWNSEDDSYFATSGSQFVLSYVVAHREDSDNYSSIWDRSSQRLFFKKNWVLAAKNYLALSSNINQFNSGGKPEYQSINSLLYSYQLKERLNGVGSRSRLYFDINPIATEYYSTINYTAGYMTEFAGFGLLKLGLTYWGSL